MLFICSIYIPFSDYYVCIIKLVDIFSQISTNLKLMYYDNLIITICKFIYIEVNINLKAFVHYVIQTNCVLHFV